MRDDFEVICSGRVKESVFEVRVAGDMNKAVLERIMKHLDLMKRDFETEIPINQVDILDWVKMCVVWDKSSDKRCAPQDIYDHYLKWCDVPPRSMHSFVRYFAQLAEANSCTRLRVNKGRFWLGLTLVSPPKIPINQPD